MTEAIATAVTKMLSAVPIHRLRSSLSVGEVPTKENEDDEAEVKIKAGDIIETGRLKRLFQRPW
jgi:hypothetical protein